MSFVQSYKATFKLLVYQYILEASVCICMMNMSKDAFEKICKRKANFFQFEIINKTQIFNLQVLYNFRFA